jgi:excisionase family DNA binding protein
VDADVTKPAARVEGDAHELVERERAAAPRPPTAGTAAAPARTLSLGQAAQALGISTTTARRWADNGRLVTTRTAGGHRRFAVTEIRRLLAERGRPALAPAEPPRRPLPALATIIDAHGPALAERSWRTLYGDVRTGWFVEPEGAAAGERWLSALSSAAVTGDYELLHAATCALMRAAERGGASLLERHLAIERLGEAASRALARRSAPREDVVDARRLFTSLGQRQLAQAG